MVDLDQSLEEICSHIGNSDMREATWAIVTAMEHLREEVQSLNQSLFHIDVVLERIQRNDTDRYVSPGED